MGDSIARCSMCKYDFQRASQGEADSAVAEAKKILTQKEEENLARTEAKRSEEEKHLAEIREKINREINTLSAQFESEKLRLDAEYAAMQKKAIDEKLKLEEELNATRAEVEVERAKIDEARLDGERIRQARIDEGEVKYQEMIRAAEEEQQKILEDAQKQTENLAIQIEKEFADAIAKRDAVVAEATELQTYLDNSDAIKKEKEEELAQADKALDEIQRAVQEGQSRIAEVDNEYKQALEAFEVEKERMAREGREIAEQQAGEALKAKEQADAEREQINKERELIIADIEQRRTEAQAELDGLVEQAKQVIAEAEEAGRQRDEIMAIVEEAQQVAAQKEELEKQIAEEMASRDKTREEFEAEMNKTREEYDGQIKDYESQLIEWNGQIEAIKGEYDEAQRIIADSKNAEIQAAVAAEQIILDAEKRAVFLKEASLSESEKGAMLKQIEEKEQKILEMEKERDALAAKIASLESSIAALEKKAMEGGFGGGADNGPKEYCVEIVPHNASSEVDVEGINKVLLKKSALGWKLSSVINDEGGKLQSSLGNDASSGSLSVGAYTSKEDRVVLIFERSKKA